MKIKLPITVNADVTTECWTYNYLTIINSYPHLQNWTMGHLESLFCDENHDCFFGDRGEYNNPYSYYNEAVTTHAIDVAPMNVQNIVTTELQKGNYLLIECDAKTLGLPDGNVLHAALIFGVDDKDKCFYVPNRINGTWQVVKYPITLFQKAMEKRNRIVTESPERWYWRWQFCVPAAVLRVQQNEPVIPPAQWLYLTLYKQMEQHDVNFTSSSSQGEVYRIFNNGYVSCCHSLFEALRDILNPPVIEIVNPRRISLNIKKLYEYQRLALKRLKSFDRLYMLNISDGIYQDMIQSIQTLEVCCNLAVKYRCKNDKALIQRILNLLVEDCQRQESCIENTVAQIARKLKPPEVYT